MRFHFFWINFNLLQLEQDEKLGSIDWNFSIDWIKKSYHFVIDWSFLMRTSGSFVFSMEFFQQSQRGSIGSLLLRCAFFLSQRQTKNSVKPSKIALRKFVMAGWTIIFFNETRSNAAALFVVVVVFCLFLHFLFFFVFVPKLLERNRIKMETR